MDLLEFIHQSNQTPNKDDLTELFLKFLSSYGLDRFVMSEMSHDTTSGKEDHHGILVNYPGHWMDHYINNNYIDHDPVYQNALISTKPFTWEQAEAEYPVTDLGQKVMDEARESKLYQGIALSIHQPFGRIIGMGFASSEKHTDCHPDTLSIIYAAANQFFMAYADLAKLSTMNKKTVKLTQRELEVLLWLARGKSKPKIADTLYVSESTVKRHCESIFSKLEVNNATLAVFKAVRMGLIKPY